MQPPSGDTARKRLLFATLKERGLFFFKQQQDLGCHLINGHMESFVGAAKTVNVNFLICTVGRIVLHEIQQEICEQKTDLTGCA